MRSSPIDDLTYDVLTVLHHKAKGLEAYDKYIRDAEDDDELQDIFQALRRQDEENVRILTEALAHRLDDELGLAAEEEEEEEEEEDEDEDAWEEGEEEAEEATTDGGGGEETASPRRGESSHRHRT